MSEQPQQTPLQSIQLPTRLEVEDKVIEAGPVSLTLRQGAIILIGGAGIVVVWKQLAFLDRYQVAGSAFGSWLHWGTALLLALGLLLFATTRRAGRTPETWGLIWLAYLRRPRRYVRADPSLPVQSQRRVALLWRFLSIALQRTPGNVEQCFVGIRAVMYSVLCVRTASTGHDEYVSVLQVSSLNYPLKSAEQQRLLTAVYQSLLASLTFPLQIIWHCSPFSLDRYMSPRVGPENGMDASASAWYRLAADQADFLHRLGIERPLFERSLYLIVRSRPSRPGLAIPGLTKGKVQAAPGSDAALERAQQDLERKIGELRRLLKAMDLNSRCLVGEELITFYQRCLAPGAAESEKHMHVQGETERPDVPDEDAEDREALRGEADTAYFEAHETESATQTTREHLSLSYRLAPAVILEAPNYVQVGEEYQRFLRVQELPRAVSLGWLRPLSELALPFDLLVHFQPLSSAMFVARFKRKQAELRSAELLAAQKGASTDPYIQIAQSDIEGLLSSVASGLERMLDWQILLRVRGRSKQDLDEHTEQLRGLLGSMQLTTPVATYQQVPALLTFRPHVRSVLPHASVPIHTSGAATAFPFQGSGIVQEDGLLEGITPNGDPIILRPGRGKLSNFNRLIVGESGNGKSYKVKADILLELARAYRPDEQGRFTGQPPLQIIVVDPDAEYIRLAHVFQPSTVIRLAPGSAQHINPFDLPRRVGEHHHLAPAAAQSGDRLADHVRRLHTLLEIMLADRTPQGRSALLSSEGGLLDRAIYETYRRAGITKHPSTHHRPAPLMADLHAVLASGVCGEDKTDLAGRLGPYVEGSLRGLFEQPTDVELENPLIIFDLHDLEDELEPVGLFLVSDFVLKHSFQSTTRRRLIIDEVATLYQFESGATFIEDLVRRARKHYLGVTVITQYPDFLEESSIPGNCAVHILMGQEATSLDLITRMFKLSPAETQELSRLTRGEGLMLIGAQHLVVQFATSDLGHLVATTDPEEIASWFNQAQPSPELDRILQFYQLDREEVFADWIGTQEANGHHPPSQDTSRTQTQVRQEVPASSDWELGSRRRNPLADA